MAETSGTPDTATTEPDKFPALASKQLRMSYRIQRGEQGVLTFEPYKSALLPLWRFKTPEIAQESAAALWARFAAYDAAGDFVGMDMARKFLQMGMTRAQRYANHKGGRKYAVPASRGGGRGTGELARGDFAGRADKQRASDIFRAVWERCRAHEGYAAKRAAFVREQKEWDAAEAKTED